MGFFLSVAQDAGFDCIGVELSQYAAQYASKIFNLVIKNCDLFQTDLEAEAYDIITVFDILELLMILIK